MPVDVQTLTRALRVLQAFEGDRRPLSHAELVRRTGYSKAAVSRVAASLVRLGYLDRAADGVRYQVGLASVHLGHRHVRGSPISCIAQPIMQALADRLRGSVALAMRDTLDAIYIGYCTSAGIATLRLRLGEVLPLASTAIGRALLWAQPPALRAQLLSDIGARAGTGSPALMTRIQAAFDCIDDHGYCSAHGEYQRDALGISVPLWLGRPQVAMGLSFGEINVAPDDGRTRSVLVPALKETALRLQAALADTDSLLF